MATYTDQIGNSVSLTSTPRRIVSVVPSQTELLYDLGLTEEVIGITKFCIHPSEWFHGKVRVGGTKQLHLERIAALQPDLIIANKEENVKEQVEALSAIAPVWVSDVNNLSDALSMIQTVAAMIGRDEQGKTLVHDIRDQFHQLPFRTEPHRFKAAYLIWKDPYMTVGGGTFINDMMAHAGLHNVFGDQQRYPEVEIDQIRNSGCEVLLLSSEPYPFKAADAVELQQILPGVSVQLVDGEMFSWYGSRLRLAASYFQRLITA